MTIGTPRLHQQNVELFAKLNQEMKSIQAQVGSGKADLKLSENLHDIAKLSAAEEKISETNQFMQNSIRATTELEFLDVALDRLQNLTVNLQELAVESGNDVLSQSERERFLNDVQMLKKEMLDVANQNDSFGNSLFGGISGKEKPFVMNSEGSVSYVGSSLAREVQVSHSLHVKQNFGGNSVFENIRSDEGKISVFEVIDDFAASLKNDVNSGTSSNLLSNGNSVDLVFPSSGPETKIEFELDTGGEKNKISSVIYGNDYSSIVTQINSLTASSGVSASIVEGNRIRLQGSVDQLHISDLALSDYDPAQSFIAVIKDTSSSLVIEKITENRLENGSISTKINAIFESFATARAEVGASSRRAQDNEAAAQDILLTLEENVTEIRDADLAALLTQLEFLMTNKEAAQATFTRITSKTLFDFLS
ncbi:MAG: flagellar hook-associated protein 3 [Euryarchaeota archaeon]|nr:flagellar hook-associated protein 3 [Euryarchaeota archaeon]|tara:strand:- start:567 stop:1835 length:1269 start_codon:yes stop_codon:yes gene_type:complete